MATYQWKKTAGGVAGVSAQDFGEAVESLGKNAGTQQIVDAARPDDSPIHRAFEWDDAVAAEAHRRSQARNHVHHLAIVVDTGTGGTKKINAFHSIKVVSGPSSLDSHRYMAVDDALSDPSSREQIIDNARRELMAWRSKYDDLCDVFGQVFDAISDVEEEEIDTASIDRRRDELRRRKEDGEVLASVG